MESMNSIQDIADYLESQHDIEQYYGYKAAEFYIEQIEELDQVAIDVENISDDTADFIVQSILDGRDFMEDNYLADIAEERRLIDELGHGLESAGVALVLCVNMSLAMRGGVSQSKVAHAAGMTVEHMHKMIDRRIARS